MHLKSKTLPYKNFLPTGQFIQAQLYQICIRQEEGSCSIAYSTRQVDSSVDAFDMNGSAAKVTICATYFEQKPKDLPS